MENPMGLTRFFWGSHLATFQLLGLVLALLCPGSDRGGSRKGLRGGFRALEKRRSAAEGDPFA